MYTFVYSCLIFGLLMKDHRTITTCPATLSKYTSATLIPKYKKVIWTAARMAHIKRDTIR